MHSNNSEEKVLKIAIVGSSNQFMTESTYSIATRWIDSLIGSYNPTQVTIVSGHSPKGGVDIIAEEVARQHGFIPELFVAQVNRWGNLGKKIGYKSRNILIAQNCDMLYSLVVGCVNCYCYHCKMYGHRRSGACWTMKEAKNLNKKVERVIL